MIIPITIKIINTNIDCRYLFGKEFTFNFDINLQINSLKKYIISYLDLDIDTKNIQIIKNNIVWNDYYTLYNTMKNHIYLYIQDNNDDIFYIYFCIKNK